MNKACPPPIETNVGGTQDVYYANSMIVPLPMMDHAAGIYMWDEDGKEYIDASSGPMVSALGHGNKRIISAMTEQANKLDYAYTRVARSRPNLEYAERLATLAGPGFERVHFASGGSEVVDNALKFLRQFSIATGQEKRRHVISLMPSYHGATIGSLAVGGNEDLAPFFDGFAITSETIPAPFSYRLPKGHSPESYAAKSAEALEIKIQELGPENVLAFIIEPIGGLSTGAIVPPDQYFRDIRNICTRYGVYLVFDEILCGAGRSGKFITAHHWPDALPDIIVKAKGLGAGYSPLGAMFAPAAMVDKLANLTGCEFSYSYNANPVSCAVGLAVLDEFERQNISERVGDVGNMLRAELEAIKERNQIIGDIRGKGLLLAVEMVSDKKTKKSLPDSCSPTDSIRKHGLKCGVMLYARPITGNRFGHWFMVAPPLNITKEECSELLRRTEASIIAFQNQLIANGII
ncbi:MAG: aminotransferase class III-fold pyridoxal phosphate-dependent enzyme [Rhodospirillales bacterium]|nr:aminotransferase class III-fold pyridoxal phosphate-dependent enzyme [Rhodospirillales bacterium]